MTVSFVFIWQVFVCLLIFPLLCHYFKVYTKEKPQEDTSRRNALIKVIGESDKEIDVDKFLYGLQIKTSGPIGKERDAEYSYFLENEFLPFRVVCTTLSEDKKSITVIVDIDLTKPTRLFISKTMDDYVGIRNISDENLSKLLKAINNEYDVSLDVTTFNLTEFINDKART
jgi:hypothetical protein